MAVVKRSASQRHLDIVDPLIANPEEDHHQRGQESGVRRTVREKTKERKRKKTTELELLDPSDRFFVSDFRSFFCCIAPYDSLFYLRVSLGARFADQKAVVVFSLLFG